MSGSCVCIVCMQTTVSVSTQQVEHIIILLHVVALLIVAVPLHLVAARKSALQPLWDGLPDRHGNVIRGGEFTPVEDIEPFGSFTVRQKVYNVAIMLTYIICCRKHIAECVFVMHIPLMWELHISFYEKVLCRCSRPEGSNSWAQVVWAPRIGVVEFWELFQNRKKAKSIDHIHTC